VLSEEIPKAVRFVDLFCGSGSVSWFAATRWETEVVACDLQRYAVILADSVISRDGCIDSEATLKRWFNRAEAKVLCHPLYKDSLGLQDSFSLGKLADQVSRARALCEANQSGPIQAAYGGHYFSPLQALWIDGLRSTLPRERDARNVALASLLQVASQCAASPGHTAQPFQVNGRADPFLLEAWQKTLIPRVSQSFKVIAGMSAKTQGGGRQCDALEFALTLNESDLVFIDPPYSVAQYSRFYHVLEVLAVGKHVTASGAGRYPAAEYRPKSEFSMKTKATIAMDTLLQRVSASGAKAILTFPADDASNGLSGERMIEISNKYFDVKHSYVSGQFSTLGGNSVIREARQHSRELILTLYPK